MFWGCQHQLKNKKFRNLSSRIPAELQGHELKVGPQALFVSQKCLHGILILVDEGRFGEAVLLVLDQFSEVDHEAPGVRAQRLQTLEENRADLLLDIGFRLCKETQQDNAEEERVAIRVAQLIDNAVEEAEASLIVQLQCDLLEQLNALSFNDLRVLRLVALLGTDSGRNVKYDCVDHC